MLIKIECVGIQLDPEINLDKMLVLSPYLFDKSKRTIFQAGYK